MRARAALLLLDLSPPTTATTILYHAENYATEVKHPLY
jgi:hypothetical protein